MCNPTAINQFTQCSFIESGTYATISLSMKGLALSLALCAIGLAQADQVQLTRSGNICHCNPEEAPIICAQDQSDSLLIVHENCNQFYKCNHGQNVSYFCPSPLLYNPLAEVCDWPGNVDCGGRPIVVKPETDEVDEGDHANNGTTHCDPSQAPAICAAGGSSGTLVAHENCNQYFMCTLGKPVVFSCANGLVYNPHTARCDWPYNVDCGDKPIIEVEDWRPDPCTCDPSQAPAICATAEDGITVGHENCNQFYECINGVPVAQTCPNGLLFNPCINRCDSPNNVECGDRPIIDQETDGNGGSGTCNCNPGEAPAICNENGSDGVLIAHEKCNKFYKCAHGINVPLSCPGDLLYDPYLQICTWPASVNCEGRPIGSNGEESDSEDSKGDDGDGEDGNVEDSNSDEGNGEDGNVEDSNGQDNNDEGNDDTSTCNCNPEEAPAICKENGSDGILIAHEKCNKFYKCANGINVPLSCPGNLLYDPKLQICNWPESVDCGKRPIDNGGNGEDGNGEGDNGEDGNGDDGNGEDGNGEGDNGQDGNGGGSGDTGTCNCNPEEAPAICQENGSDGILIAHEKCNKFYKCANGINVPLSCPGNLLYDPKLQICNWPESVDCGKRPIDNGGNGEDGNGEGDNGEDGNGDDGNGEDGNGEGDNGQDGNGGGSGDTGTCNCNPEEAPAICQENGSDGILIAHEKCNKFYKCANGINVPLSCPGNLLYDPKLQICNWPESVDCGKRPIDNGGNGEDGNGEGDNGEDGNGDDGNGEDGNGEGDNGQDGNGGGSGDTGTCNCNPEEAPAICKENGSDGILIAHEKCNKFYKCANGINVPLSCPGNLLYDPKLQICNWPESVDCGKRPIDNGGNGEDGNGEGDNGEDGNGDDGNGEDGNGEGDNGQDGNGGGSGDTGTCNCNPEEAPAICKENGSDGILIAHEKCNKFYKCANGINVPLSCPGNLLYDPKLQICNWPESVDCGKRPIDNGGNGEDSNGEDGNGEDGNDEGDNGEDGNGEGSGDIGTCNCNPEEAPAICKADGSDGVLIAHEKCNKFYKCDSGINVPLSCPGDLLYDPKLEICNWPQNVECEDRVKENKPEEEKEDDGCTDDKGESIDCNCLPEEASRICQGALSDGLIIAHENCNQFYQCAQGLPVTVSCQNGLLFNQFIQRCDWPQNVECGNRPIAEIEIESEQDKDDENDDNEVTCNCDPAEAPAICSSSDSEGVLIAHEICNKFYKCSFGSPLAFACSGALLYNPFIKACDWPSNVECGDREILPEPELEIGGGGGENNETVEAHCDPSQAPAICASAGSNGVLVAHENCNQFYVCASGAPVALSCNPNLLFNPVNGQCDWPSNVDCGDRFVAEPEVDDGPCLCRSSEAPSICAGNDSNGKMIAHEACSQYYVCFNGKPIARSCPRGLFYEPHTKQCNSPAQVSCDGRDVTPHLSINKHMLAQTRFF